MKLEIDCFSAHFQISLIIFHDIYKIQEFFFDPIQFSIFLNMYNHLKTEYKVSNSFLFIGLSEKMLVFAETGNLCPKKSGGKLSLKKKKKKKKKLECYILLLIMFLDPVGVWGACTDLLKWNYWYFFISCNGKLALRIFFNLHPLLATSPEWGDCKFDSVLSVQWNASLQSNPTYVAKRESNVWIHVWIDMLLPSVGQNKAGDRIAHSITI